MAKRTVEQELLALAHARPGITRADAMRTLGLGSGRGVELVGRLESARLISERRAEPAGRRGRPTAQLVPHLDGPLVVAVSVQHDTWRVRVAALGGTVLAESHGTDPSLEMIAIEVRRQRRRFGSRIRAVAISVPGVVRAGVVVQASNLGWREVDLRVLWPRPGVGVAVLVGNDASFAGWAESRRGAAVGVGGVLHLHVDSGLGGVHLTRDAPPPGDTDLAGEFGHMPFGDARLLCECGAHGCWDLMVDGRALARALGEPAPRDPAAYLLAASRRGDARTRRALGRVAGALGRGTAGLVNALDPQLVTFGGSAAVLLEVAPEAVRSAYLDGLMAFRRPSPVPLVAARLGPDGPLIGAVEVAFARVLAPEGLSAWTGRSGV
jgi:predicted NBD/HSP70 family sugar kinase